MKCADGCGRDLAARTIKLVMDDPRGESDVCSACWRERHREAAEREARQVEQQAQTQAQARGAKR